MAAAAFLLLVTWFSMAGASSYQVDFADRDKCEQAAASLVKEQDRMRAQLGEAQAKPKSQLPGFEAMAAMMGPMMQGMVQPSVSAICVER
jgi:hypothetical protein